MVESDSYGSDHFPIDLKIGADWVQFDHLCKE